MIRLSSLLLSLALVLGLVVAVPGTADANGILIASDAGRPTPGSTAPDGRSPRRPTPLVLPTPDRRPAGPVYLKGHTVRATVRDQIVNVRVEQVFHNNSNGQLEGTYLFPLPEGATISDWQMTMFGKMVRGEIIEADKAREIYQSIVSRRRDPGLLEYMGRGLFQAKVFPIMPHKDLTIRLEFQMVLPEDGNTLEFRYPLNTSKMNATAVDSVLVDVQIESQQDLKAIFSASHDVEIARDGERKARVTYERSGRKQDKDFLLYIGRSPDALGMSVQSHQPVGAEGTFMTVLTPRTEVKAEDRVAKDIVFVLDTSGSMAQNDRIEQARAALIHGLRVLQPGDRFGMIGFGSAVRPFRDNLLEVNAETVAAAEAWVKELKPRGGTNIEGALQKALAMQDAGERLKMVVFLTDGRPTIGERDAGALVKRVETAKGTTQIFTFGVGVDLDVSLLDRIAEVTNGARDYVVGSDNIELVTSRFYRKVDSPVLTDVTIEFGDGVVDVYPKTFPAMFAGSQIVIFGRYREAGDRVIRVSGKVAGKPVTLDYEVTFKKGEHADYLPRLWAHRKIGYLLDEVRLHGQTPEIVDEIIELATKHAIVTPYTAGLVVEESELQGRSLREVVDSMPSRRDRIAGGPTAGAPRTRSRLGDGFFRIGGRVPGGSAADRAAPMPPTGPATPAPTTPVARPEEAVEDSRELGRMKSDANLEGAEMDGESPANDPVAALRERVKTVGTRTFMKGADDRWVQRGYTNGTTTQKVEAYSEAYFGLLEKSESLVRVLALGERVVFKYAGTWYEIQPAN